MTTFSDLGLAPKVLRAVSDAGYETPTPIQIGAIPPALEGRDVLGIAQTGTGKTAGFVLPMITLLARGRARARMPRSLVLCPTRELAAQVAENFDTYSQHVKLTKALLIGGVSFKEQDTLIDKGVDVLIATPGRLLDHFERGKLLLTGVQIMVVDEADRMLDMGFIPDIERIFSLTPFTRQTLFFSATMAPEIERITNTFLSNPAKIEVARQATASETIEQAVVMFKASRRERAASEKRDCLRDIIRAEGEKCTNAIIFCNRKTDVDIVSKSLKKHGFDAEPIHGDLDQSVRTRTLDLFRDGKLKLLVASDVAARGLDVPAVSHVFNFDVPSHAEDYIHRIGRTGRAGRDGKAIMICEPRDEKNLAAVEKLIGKPIPRNGAVVPAVAETLEEPAPKPTRSRSRRKPAAQEPDVPAVAEVAEVAAAETEVAQPVETRAEKPVEQRPAKPDRKVEAPRRERRNGRQGEVVGMGDHMPGFIAMSFDERRTD
ncbi:MAG: DEAD/DEAH box helicase [Rhodobacter sp.]|nr:DEAD/DEAH box helicase [Rhodobacter sp.]